MTDAARFALPAIDPATVPARIGETDYPEIFQPGMDGATRRRLGDAAGLTNFGINLTTLPPGFASAQRHWHTTQDEFIYVVSGELTLITDGGEQILTAGMAAGFPAGVPDGHQLVNRGNREATYLEIGDRSPADDCHYPDVDLVCRNVDGDQRYIYQRKDGTPY